MTKRIENILQAINLADLDGIKSADTLVSDLQLLRRHILSQDKQVIRLNKELNIVRVGLALKELEQPYKLDVRG